MRFHAPIFHFPLVPVYIRSLSARPGRSRYHLHQLKFFFGMVGVSIIHRVDVVNRWKLPVEYFSGMGIRLSGILLHSIRRFKL